MDEMKLGNIPAGGPGAQAPAPGREALTENGSPGRNTLLQDRTQAGPERAQPAMAPLAPSEVDFMPPLLRSLSTLMRLRGKNISANFLLSGLAGAGKISTGASLRAAAKAGFLGRVMFRETLKQISPLTLPCILLLQGDRSCVLVALRETDADIILPENMEDPVTVTREELEKEYSGYAIFGTFEKRLDSRAEKLRLSKGKRWFWDVLTYFSPIYGHVAIASIIINLIAVASPLFVMNVYDRVVPNNAFETLWVLAIGISIAYLFDFILKSLRSHFVDVAGRNADVILSSTLVDKVLTMQLDSKPESTGALVNNLREFESLREFFSSSTLLACIDLPFLFIFLVLIYFIGGPLVVLPLVAMPLMFIAGLVLQSASKRSAEQTYKHNMTKNALLVEMVNGLETVKSSMAESRMQRLWEAVVGISAQSSTQARRYNNLAIGISTLITQLVTVAMIIWGVYLISVGDLSMGGLIGCNILVGRAMAPLLQMASLLTRLQNSRVSLSALDQLMTLPSENQDEKTCMDFGLLNSSFSMEDVSFSYPGQERLALDRVSLRIEPGEKVGIIGKMGSGKSTLGKLLIGLYQPKEGAVKFGDVDIRQLASADLRGRVGVLPQEVILFYGTIRDNIALGDPSINDHLILRAASLAGVAEFIKNNPAGFGAQVGEQGRNLSGGQRQAVGLARALVRDPDVLILDEPTSNMDTDSELMVQRRLASIMQNKTLLLITHRLSMLRIVNRLIVMDQGKVLHDGPRDKVLQMLQGHQKPPAGAKPPTKAPVVPHPTPGTTMEVNPPPASVPGPKEKAEPISANQPIPPLPRPMQAPVQAMPNPPRQVAAPASVNPAAPAQGGNTAKTLTTPSTTEARASSKVPVPPKSSPVPTQTMQNQSVQPKATPVRKTAVPSQAAMPQARSSSNSKREPVMVSQ